MKDPHDTSTGELELNTAPDQDDDEPSLTMEELVQGANDMWCSIVALSVVSMTAQELLERKGSSMDSQEFLDVLAEKMGCNERARDEAKKAMMCVVSSYSKYGSKEVLASLGFLHQRSMDA